MNSGDEFIDPWEPTHDGPPSTVEYHRGCRCGGCRAARCARTLELRAEKKSRRVLIDGRLVAPTNEHGTISTYNNWGCRCDPCVEAATAYHRRYRALRRGNA